MRALVLVIAALLCLLLALAAIICLPFAGAEYLWKCARRAWNWAKGKVVRA